MECWIKIFLRCFNLQHIFLKSFFYCFFLIYVSLLNMKWCSSISLASWMYLNFRLRTRSGYAIFNILTCWMIASWITNWVINRILSKTLLSIPTLIHFNRSHWRQYFWEALSISWQSFFRISKWQFFPIIKINSQSL